MFLKKNFPTVKSQREKVFVDFEKSTSAICHNNSYNTVVRHGKLRSTPNYTLACEAAYVYGAIDIGDDMIYSSPTGIFIKQDNGRLIRIADALQKPNFFYCEKPTILLASQKGSGTYAHTSDWNRVTYNYFDSFAMSGERVFGVTGKYLYYTSVDDPTDWSGQLILPERVSAVVTYNNDVLAVGNHVFKLEIDEENSKVSRVFGNFGTVYPQTVKVVGNKMFFKGPNGLFCYSKNAVKQIAKEVVLDKNENAVAAVSDGVYYLTFTDEQNNNRVLAVDCDSEQTRSILNIDTDILCGGKRLCFKINGRLYTFGDGYTESFWQSTKYGFDTPSVRKSLRTLYIQSSSDVDIHVITERERKIYHINGSDELQKIKIKGSCYRFYLEIYGEGLDISQLGIEINTCQSEVKYGY